MIRPEDTFVITGDHSWGRNMEECAPDFAFIEQLPGRKILLRGNHDMFWDSGASKTKKLNEQFDGRLFFLQNNFYSYEDYALVGTKVKKCKHTRRAPSGKFTGWTAQIIQHEASHLDGIII